MRDNPKDMYVAAVFLSVTVSMVRMAGGTCLTEDLEPCSFPFLSMDGKTLFYECDTNGNCAVEVDPDSRHALRLSKCSKECLDNSTHSYCLANDLQSCRFPFRYGGMNHHGCTTMGHSESWCLLEDGTTTASCDEACPGYEAPEDLMDSCKTTEGNLCQFPFFYGGKIYNSCTLDGHDYPWCPTVVNGRGEPEFFGNCSYQCEGFAEEAGRCRSVYGTACIFPFEYKGIIYNECTEVDHVWKWCSVFNFSNGTMRNWGECLDKTCGLSDGSGDSHTMKMKIIISFLTLSLLFNVLFLGYGAYKWLADRQRRRKIRISVKSHFNEAQNSFIINEMMED